MYVDLLRFVHKYFMFLSNALNGREFFVYGTRTEIKPRIHFLDDNKSIGFLYDAHAHLHHRHSTDYFLKFRNVELQRQCGFLTHADTLNVTQISKYVNG